MDEIDLTDGREDDVLGMVAAAALENAADQLGLVRLELAMGTAMDRTCLDAVLAGAIRTMRAAGQALAGGAAVLALAVAGLVFLPGGMPTASAATVAAPVAAIEAPQPDPLFRPLPTKFNRGLWVDYGTGDLAISAPLVEYVASIGWIPSPWTGVQVQEYVRGHWVVRARLTTDCNGWAAGVVHLGGGVHTVRVVHPRSVWTLPTTGTTRRVVVTTEPLDIV